MGVCTTRRKSRIFQVRRGDPKVCTTRKTPNESESRRKRRMGKQLGPIVSEYVTRTRLCITIVSFIVKGFPGRVVTYTRYARRTTRTDTETKGQS